MFMNFELNRLLLTSGQHIEIVHLFQIAAAGRKNIKPTSNALRPTMQLLSNDDNIGVELRDKAIIKANGRLFKITAAANKYVETFYLWRRSPLSPDWNNRKF